jgi:ribosomal protein S18 acetylase RimI-like enzyme
VTEIKYWAKKQETSTLRELFLRHWHDDYVIGHGRIYHPEDLEAFVAIDETKDIKGLLTFVVEENALEVVTIDSFAEGQGIGSRLLKSAEQEAIKRQCERLWLITTNDNLHALGFYQRRSFQIVSVSPNAVDKSRKIKPSIPLKAENGIPIRDELTLEKCLNLPQSQGGDSA